MLLFLPRGWINPMLKHRGGPIYTFLGSERQINEQKHILHVEGPSSQPTTTYSPKHRASPNTSGCGPQKTNKTFSLDFWLRHTLAEWQDIMHKPISGLKRSKHLQTTINFRDMPHRSSQISFQNLKPTIQKGSHLNRIVLWLLALYREKIEPQMIPRLFLTAPSTKKKKMEQFYVHTHHEQTWLEDTATPEYSFVAINVKVFFFFFNFRRLIFSEWSLCPQNTSGSPQCIYTRFFISNLLTLTHHVNILHLQANC